jgi:hypothetical protein
MASMPNSAGDGVAGAAGAGTGGGRLRALSFTRHVVGGSDGPRQRAVFTSACAARGWYAGGAVRQYGQGGGLRPWAAAMAMVRRGLYDVIVIDGFDRICDDDDGMVTVLGMLRRAGIRLLIAGDGVDTADRVGRGLVDSLLDGYGLAGAAR